MSNKTVTKILGPLNRVEGDLSVRLEVTDNIVSKAWVNSPLFRGFEHILQGKLPYDALVYTPRICGICSVAQSVASAMALADYQGIKPTTNGQLAINLALACENIADHLSHFYLFFMPDFARKEYAQQAWFNRISKRFKAQVGEALNQVLPARAAFMHLTGIVAGKWPHSLAIQPGGVSKSISDSERLRLAGIIYQFRDFLESVLFGDTLENICAIDSVNALDDWLDKHPDSDFAAFLTISQALALEKLGKTDNIFMSYGAYGFEDEHLFQAGVVHYHQGQFDYQTLDQQQISEDISHSWLRADFPVLHPKDGQTQPDADADGYTWCKAPRYQGKTVEVGALARQLVNGNPLLQDMVNQQGASVHSRISARMIEMALVVIAMEKWCLAIAPEQLFCQHTDIPKSGSGIGMIEAARGSLGHWLTVEKGKISNYQIIAPTTWNFSPQDGQDKPGALEMALAGIAIDHDIESTVAIQHVIRSFDPCMVCTVH